MNRWILTLLLFFLSYSSNIYSKPTFVLESLESSRFPIIELSLRENFPYPLGVNNLVVAEEMDGVRTIPYDLEVQRTPGVEPIQLVVSIQPTDSKAINQWSTDLVISLSSILQPKDRMHVHIQEERRFLYLANQNTASLRTGFILPSVETYSKTLESLSILLDKLSISSKKPPFLLVVLHSKSIPDKIHLVDLSKKARRMGIPIHILSFESREAEKLAEYTDGRLYSIKDKDSTKKLFDDILYYKKPPYQIRYRSRQKIQLLDEKTVQVDIGILNIQNLSSEYSVNAFTRLEDAILDPFVFLPSAIFILLICLSALVLLPRIRNAKRKKYKFKDSDLSSNEEIDEERVYELMYGKKDHSAEKVSPDIHQDVYESSLESIDSDPSGAEIGLGGESYQKAVLIQKEGPSPGRQYNVYGHETLIGRLETNHLVIWDNSLSPVHARIKNIQNRFVLYDMLSHSGVFLNGKKLLRPKVLYDFDEILLGKTLLIFRGK